MNKQNKSVIISPVVEGVSITAETVNKLYILLKNLNQINSDLLSNKTTGTVSRSVYDKYTELLDETSLKKYKDLEITDLINDPSVIISMQKDVKESIVRELNEVLYEYEQENLKNDGTSKLDYQTGLLRLDYYRARDRIIFYESALDKCLAYSRDIRWEGTLPNNWLSNTSFSRVQDVEPITLLKSLDTYSKTIPSIIYKSLTNILKKLDDFNYTTVGKKHYSYDNCLIIFFEIENYNYCHTYEMADDNTILEMVTVIKKYYDNKTRCDTMYDLFYELYNNTALFDVTMNGVN